jgi:hypothetical protein
MVVLSDAVEEPGTVMIHLQNTLVTYPAVMGPRWFWLTTFEANLPAGGGGVTVWGEVGYLLGKTWSSYKSFEVVKAYVDEEIITQNKPKCEK